jgi:hypothetical protein
MVWRYAWPIAVAQGLWGLVALRHGRGWAWLRGKVEGLRRLAEFDDVAHAPVRAVSRLVSTPSVDMSADAERTSTCATMQILRGGEQEIRRVQRESGRDLYWDLYFLFTAGGAK